MADVYLNEHEQLQVIKDWLKKYGASVIIGILIAVIGSYGYRYWQQRQLIAAERASVIYEQMLGSAAKNQTQAMQQFAGQLLTDYSRTPYADLAGLMLAKNAANNHQYDVAVQKLQWVIDHAHDSALKQIARVRAARVLLAQGQPEAAWNLLQIVDNPAFQAAIDEVRGDILVVQGKTAEARAAYHAALASMPTSAMSRMLLQMKYDQLTEIKQPEQG